MFEQFLVDSEIEEESEEDEDYIPSEDWKKVNTKCCLKSLYFMNNELICYLVTLNSIDHPNPLQFFLIIKRFDSKKC